MLVWLRRAVVNRWGKGGMHGRSGAPGCADRRAPGTHPAGSPPSGRGEGGVHVLTSAGASGRALVGMVAVSLGACALPAERIDRRGEEIVVCGQLYSIGTPVVLWTDPGGYDAYRTQKRFAPVEQREWVAGGGLATPNRYGDRRVDGDAGLEAALAESGWTLELLRRRVDQFVIHYDAAGTSRACFRVLQDVRGLSVHFMIDIDGTIYQTLDVKEKAWHATIANDRSVGVEMSNIGAYAEGSASPLERWYSRDEAGAVIVMPPDVGGGGVRSAGPFRPVRDGPIVGTVQGQRLVMQDFTSAQYEALVKLTAGLCAVLPGIACDYPRDAVGGLESGVLGSERFASYRGLLGHFHVQQNKVDPGPAFDWERVVSGARRRMR